MLTSDSRWALQGSNLRPPPCKSDTTRDSMASPAQQRKPCALGLRRTGDRARHAPSTARPCASIWPLRWPKRR